MNPKAWIVAALLIPIVQAGGPATPAPREEPTAAARTGPKAEAKAEAARRAARQARVFFLERRIGIDTAYLWAIRALESRLATCRDEGERAAAYREHLAAIVEIERIIRASARIGMATELETAACAYYRAEAELWLEPPDPRP